MPVTKVMTDSEEFLLGRTIRNEKAANDIAKILNGDTSGGGGPVGAGVGVYDLTIPIAALGTTAGASNFVTGLIIKHKFKILGWDFVTTKIGVGAGASQTFNMAVGADDVVGSNLIITTAGTNQLGKITEGSPLTGMNEGDAGGTLTIEKASGGVVFTDGAGFFRITIQNMDTAEAIAALSA